MNIKSIRLRGLHGFTLIELLIVVAIIAILAAIAVPNFLEAQTRAKVSRAKADMRTIATATEAYAVDYNRYPIPADENGYLVPLSLMDSVFMETRVSPILTTPVAYLTSLLNEPFPGPIVKENPQFHYGTKAYVEFQQGPEHLQAWDGYMVLLTNKAQPTVKYFILSHGPDQDHDAPEHHHHSSGEHEEGEEHEGGPPALYDPTNGTLSSGDIVYFGPGTGFLN
jgi:prepilin-type N-terminal cleavage/methylation domain-containing protein